MKELFFAGVDIGSTTAETVLLDAEGQIVSTSMVLTGFNPKAAIEESVEKCCNNAGIKAEDITYCISTGYGRELVSIADRQFTEIACHGRGAHYFFHDARGVIDIGGQDSKAMLLNEKGAVVNFAMNDRCAAGTGRFLDVMAGIMKLSTEEMGHLSLKAEKVVPVSSICTVFAESEVISLISKDDTNPYDVMAGIHMAVAKRVFVLTSKARIEKPIVMSGGVAKNVGVVHAFEELLNTKLMIPEDPSIVGAVGAAVTARELYFNNNEKQL